MRTWNIVLSFETRFFISLRLCLLQSIILATHFLKCLAPKINGAHAYGSQTLWSTVAMLLQKIAQREATPEALISALNLPLFAYRYTRGHKKIYKLQVQSSFLLKISNSGVGSVSQWDWSTRKKLHDILIDTVNYTCNSEVKRIHTGVNSQFQVVAMQLSVPDTFACFHIQAYHHFGNCSRNIARTAAVSLANLPLTKQIKLSFTVTNTKKYNV